MIKERLKSFALKHNFLLSIYRSTFGKLKTKYFFQYQMRNLQKYGYSFMEKIENVLTESGACYFIDSGTLLGMYREQKLLEHDRDMDYGIYFDESFSVEDLDAAMQKIGLKRKKFFSFRGDIKELTYSDGKNNIDFFKHEEDGINSKIYVFYRKLDEKYPSKNHYTTLIMHRAPISGVQKVKIGDLEVTLPNNPEAYLESAYTKNWSIPDPTWRYLMEPGLEEVNGEYGLLEHI